MQDHFGEASTADAHVALASHGHIPNTQLPGLSVRPIQSGSWTSSQESQQISMQELNADELQSPHQFSHDVQPNALQDLSQYYSQTSAYADSVANVSYLEQSWPNEGHSLSSESTAPVAIVDTHTDYSQGHFGIGRQDIHDSSENAENINSTDWETFMRQLGIETMDVTMEWENNLSFPFS